VNYDFHFVCQDYSNSACHGGPNLLVQEEGKRLGN
jgi:hypothetical protein